MATDHELELAGDELQSLLRRAVAALMDDNIPEVWQILEVQAYRASRNWDRLRGRPVPTDEQIAEARRALAELGERAQEAVNDRLLTEVRRTVESH